MDSSFGVGMRGARALIAAFALVLSPAIAHASDNDEAFAALRATDARVATVGYTLASRNTALCATGLAPLSGLSLHALAQYGAADRADVTRLFGMTRWPGVMAVVPGSAAERAGVRQDDQIVAVGNVALDETPAARSSSRDLVERANRALTDALAKGPAALTVLRQGTRMELTLAPVSGCASDIELLSSDAVNAWADGRHIMIGGGLLDLCESDDDLALVIAHEMAHNIFDARARTDRATATRGRAAETAADALAVKMMIAAGYDPDLAIRALGKLMRHRGVSFSHPGPTRRIAALQAAVVAARP
jgi:hypothetical protein